MASELSLKQSAKLAGETQNAFSQTLSAVVVIESVDADGNTQLTIAVPHEAYAKNNQLTWNVNVAMKAIRPLAEKKVRVLLPQRCAPEELFEEEGFQLRVSVLLLLA